MKTKLKTGDFLNTDSQCQICSSSSRRLISNIGRSFQKIDTVICTDCGLIHSHPIPTKSELDIFYAEKYRTSYKHTVKPKLKHVLRYSYGANQRVKFLKKFSRISQKILLDIGSGSGEFLYMACKAGFVGRGIEPHKGYAAYTYEELGLNVENNTLEEANLQQNSVDIISLNHVLEHMQKPYETLVFLNTILKEDGLLMVDVPDVSKIRHAPWTQFHYAHIYNFNFYTLKSILEKSGFEVLNPESLSTNLIARKINKSKDVLGSDLKDNYVSLWKKISHHTTLNHYTSSRPYMRFFQKCYQYPYEIILTSFKRSPKEILDSRYIE